MLFAYSVLFAGYFWGIGVVQNPDMKLEIRPMAMHSLKCYWMQKKSRLVDSKYTIELVLRNHISDGYSPNKCQNCADWHWSGSESLISCVKTFPHQWSMLAGKTQGATKVVVLLPRTWVKGLWTSEPFHLLVQRTSGFQNFSCNWVIQDTFKLFSDKWILKWVVQRTSGSQNFCHTLEGWGFLSVNRL